MKPLIKACLWCGKPLDEPGLCPRCEDDLKCICDYKELGPAEDGVKHSIWCPASLLEEKENGCF